MAAAISPSKLVSLVYRPTDLGSTSPVEARWGAVAASPSALCPSDISPALCPQGTPLKYDSGSSSSSTKKHDVRSIIGSPGRTFHSVHSLDVIQDPRNLERAYEESLKNRPSPVTNSGGSIARGAPVIVPEPGKPHQSALAYEDHQAGHSTAFSSHLHRGSPVSTRESTPRQHEGTCQPFVGC